MTALHGKNLSSIDMSERLSGLRVTWLQLGLTWAKTDLVPSVNPTNELETKMVVDMALYNKPVKLTIFL